MRNILSEINIHHHHNHNNHNHNQDHNQDETISVPSHQPISQEATSEDREEANNRQQAVDKLQSTDSSLETVTSTLNDLIVSPTTIDPETQQLNGCVNETETK